MPPPAATPSVPFRPARPPERTSLLAVAVVAGTVAAMVGLPPSASVAAEAPAPPQRIASISVCTDQLLALLAPSGRILSVTQHLGDPAFSNMPDAARGIAVNFGMAERILPDRPDLVLTQAFSNRRTAQLMESLKVPVEILPLADDLATVRSNLTSLGDRLGAAPRASAILAEMESRLDRATAPAGGERPVIAIYGANGFTSGADTLIDELVTRAGFRNLAAEMGLRGPAEMSLERLLTSRVDALLLPLEGGGAPSLALEQARHPAIRRLRRDLPTLTLPSRLWICGTPHLVEAAEALAAFRARLAPNRRPGNER